MAKILVIRKPDKTIHKVPVDNEASLKAYSNRLPVAEQWKFETMEESEAEKLPFIDESYVTASEAQGKVAELEASSAAKDERIAELERMLAEKNDPAAPTEKAVDVIAKIEAATTAEEAQAIAGNDTRKTVTDALVKKLASLE
ncbi:hypothetical protein JMG10_07575 [Nostoc ellipsosporum NOK]|nr:hypothetical protein [Nostoc ellipsosporum NOK]